MRSLKKDLMGYSDFDGYQKGEPTQTEVDGPNRWLPVPTGSAEKIGDTRGKTQHSIEELYEKAHEGPNDREGGSSYNGLF